MKGQCQSSSNYPTTHDQERKQRAGQQVLINSCKSVNACLISHIYGMQFQSQVPLFQQIHSSNMIKIFDLESFQKNGIFHKVYIFINSLIATPSLYQKLFQCFNILDNQMKLSIYSSKKSMISNHQNLIKEKKERLQADLRINKFKVNTMDSNNKRTISDVSIKLVNKAQQMGQSKRISIADKMKKLEIDQIIPQQTPSVEFIGSINILNSNQQTSLKSNQVIRYQSAIPKKISNKSQKLFSQIQLKNATNVSLVIMEENENSLQSDFISEEEVFSLSELNIPLLPYNEKTVQIIFETSQPFLINLALSLLIKWAIRTQFTLTYENVGWIMTIVTLISYKIYYDQQIEGLFQCFSQILSLDVKSVVKLERWVLQELGYQVVISNRQYQQIMLCWLNQP